jgi:hypothetical protein
VAGFAATDTANGGWKSEENSKYVLQKKKIPYSFNAKRDFSFANRIQTNQNVNFATLNLVR